jgi:hypothetical protein
MSEFDFSPDDFLVQPSSDDALHQQLGEAIAKRFYQTCSGITQLILSSCEWQITKEADCLSLIVICANDMDYWHFISNLPEIESKIKQFTNHFKVQIFSSLTNRIPFEVEMAEIMD